MAGFSLPMLLQAAGVLPTQIADSAAPNQQPPPEAPDIVVNRPINSLFGRPPEDDPAPINLGNRSMLEEIQQAQDNAPQHKGMFGLHGTLRDILGTLGDSFLVQSGNNRVYAPQREQERLSDAIAGFTQNPQAAIERTAGVDPKSALALYQDVAKNNIQQQAAQIKAQLAAEKRYQDAIRLYSQASGAFAHANPQTRAALVPILQSIKERGGLGDEYVIPDVNDNGVAAALQSVGTPTQAQIRDDRQQQAEEGRNQRAAMQEAGRERRYKPPQPKNPTAASIAYPLLQKAQSLGGFDNLPPEDQETLKSLNIWPGRAEKKSNRKPSALEAITGGGAAAPSKPSGKLVFRNGKLVAQ